MDIYFGSSQKFNFVVRLNMKSTKTHKNYINKISNILELRSDRETSKLDDKNENQPGRTRHCTIWNSHVFIGRLGPASGDLLRELHIRCLPHIRSLHPKAVIFTSLSIATLTIALQDDGGNKPSSLRCETVTESETAAVGIPLPKQLSIYRNFDT